MQEKVYDGKRRLSWLDAGPPWSPSCWSTCCHGDLLPLNP